MVFTEKESLGKIQIVDDRYELFVSEASYKGEVIKYLYNIYCNGRIKIGFCTAELEEFDLEELIEQYGI